MLPPTECPSTGSGQCPDCKGAGFFRCDVPVGDPDFGKLVRCKNPVHAPDRVRRLAGFSGLDQDDLKRRLCDIKKNGENDAVLEAAREIALNPRGWLFIHGGPGNAKTEILIAVINEINAANQGPAMFIKLSKLVNLMRNSYAEREYQTKQMYAGNDPENWQRLGYLDRFEQLKNIKVLAIDEFDKVRTTDFGLEFIFDFMDERYRQAVHHQTLTIMASQTSPEALPDPLSSRINDGRFKVICNEAGDTRPDMEWEE